MQVSSACHGMGNQVSARPIGEFESRSRCTVRVRGMQHELVLLQPRSLRELRSANRAHPASSSTSSSPARAAPAASCAGRQQNATQVASNGLWMPVAMSYLELPQLRAKIPGGGLMLARATPTAPANSESRNSRASRAATEELALAAPGSTSLGVLTGSPAQGLEVLRPLRALLAPPGRMPGGASGSKGSSEGVCSEAFLDLDPEGPRRTGGNEPLRTWSEGAGVIAGTPRGLVHAELGNGVGQVVDVGRVFPIVVRRRKSHIGFAVAGQLVIGIDGRVGVIMLYSPSCKPKEGFDVGIQALLPPGWVSSPNGKQLHKLFSHKTNASVKLVGTFESGPGRYGPDADKFRFTISEISSVKKAPPTHQSTESSAAPSPAKQFPESR